MRTHFLSIIYVTTATATAIIDRSSIPITSAHNIPNGDCKSGQPDWQPLKLLKTVTVGEASTSHRGNLETIHEADHISDEDEDEDEDETDEEDFTKEEEVALRELWAAVDGKLGDNNFGYGS